MKSDEYEKVISEHTTVKKTGWSEKYITVLRESVKEDIVLLKSMSKKCRIEENLKETNRLFLD